MQAYKIKLEREADFDKAVWCNIVTGNSILTIGLVYEEDNAKMQNAIKKVRFFCHGHIQCKSLEQRG